MKEVTVHFFVGAQYVTYADFLEMQRQRDRLDRLASELVGDAQLALYMTGKLELKSVIEARAKDAAVALGGE